MILVPPPHSCSSILTMFRYPAPTLYIIYQPPLSLFTHSFKLYLHPATFFLRSLFWSQFEACTFYLFVSLIAVSFPLYCCSCSFSLAFIAFFTFCSDLGEPLLCCLHIYRISSSLDSRHNAHAPLNMFHYVRVELSLLFLSFSPISLAENFIGRLSDITCRTYTNDLG